MNAAEATNELQKCLRTWMITFICEKYEENQAEENSDSYRLQILEELCQRGADLNYLEHEREFKCIPHVFWSETLIKFFLDRGRDINSKDENGDTALRLAIEHANVELNTDNFCPKYFDLSFGVIKFLAEQSSAEVIRGPGSRSACFLLIQNEFFNPENEWTTKIAKMFLETTNVISSEIGTVSITHNIIDELIYYFEGDIERGMSNRPFARTLLMDAVCLGKLEYCRILIEKGANVNARDFQGYTPLYYAVFGRKNECIKFLLENGADPELKSVSRKNPNDLNKNIFLNELIHIIFSNNVVNPNNENDKVLSVVNTVVRLSDGTSKFWNLLTRSFHKAGLRNFVQYLNCLSKELNGWSEDGDLASFEIPDIKSLLELIKLINDWLLGDARSKNEANSDTISQIHSIAKLIIACLDKLTHLTKLKTVYGIGMQLYVTLCHVLTLIRFRFDDIMSETELKNDNDRLLKNLVDLDLRDQLGNSLMHLLLSQEYDSFKSDLVAGFIDLDLVKVTMINKMGFEPIQWMRTWKFNDNEVVEIFVKMADRGAHVDARIPWYSYLLSETNLWEEIQRKSNVPSLTWFRYESLQCACARVIAKSLVPFRNQGVEHLVPFIHAHIQYRNNPLLN